MPETLTLSVLHAGSKDRMVMRSLLNLVGGRSNGPDWILIDKPGGDVTIVDVDNAGGQQAWPGLLEGTGIVIAMTREEGFDAPALLHKPLRSRDFLKLLGRVTGSEVLSVAAWRRSKKDEAATKPAGEASSVASSAPILEVVAQDSGESEVTLTLADHLRCQTWLGPVALTSQGWPVLLIDPSSGTWFFDGSIGDLDPGQFARPIPASAGIGLSNSELVERIQGHRQRTLSELKWYAGLAQLPGRLHPELRGEVQFMLTQVPPEAMKNELLHGLARIVLRGPIDLGRLLAESGQPEANVSAFLNACFCSGKLLINRSSRAVSF